MAGRAQTEFGPRTVALSLKVFIVVMFYAHERLGMCTAQVVLPHPLIGYLKEMKDHFCSAWCVSDEHQLPVMCGDDQWTSSHHPSVPNQLCSQICIAGDCNNNCWEVTDNIYIPTYTYCNVNWDRICGYSDANVCQNKNGDRTIICVYTEHFVSAFCICQDEPNASYTRCDEHSWFMPMGPKHKPTAPNNTDDNELNVAAVVLGSLFALLLLLVIIGAVILRLRRQGRLPSFMKQTPNPAEPSSIPLEAMNTTRLRMPEPPISGSMDNLYKHDHRPAKPSANEDPDQDDHTYCYIGEDGHREGNPRHDYTSLVPTGNPKTRTEPSEDEVAASPTSPKETSPIDSPTKAFSNEENGTYFPLIPSAEPKSHVEQSGYEDAKILTSESHDATSPTGAQSISGDDNTYTPLVRTVEPKSQKEQSGYEAAIIPNPGLAADSDATTPDDLSGKKGENESNEGALSTADVDGMRTIEEWRVNGRAVNSS